MMSFRCLPHHKPAFEHEKRDLNDWREATAFVERIEEQLMQQGKGNLLNEVDKEWTTNGIVGRPLAFGARGWLVS